jgi:hypothetical protein
VPSRNGHWYNISSASSSFGSALSSARQSLYRDMTGYLATIDSAAENAFVSHVFPSTLAWIGGQELRQDGNWTWASGPEQGQPMRYTAWGQGVNFANRQPECAYVNSSTWGAQGCNSALPYVIEYCVVVDNTCARTLCRAYVWCTCLH